MRTYPRRTAVAVVALAAAAAAASAIVLTFDDVRLLFPDLSPAVPEDYGDRVTDFIDPVTGYTYGAAGGLTPNIVVDYVPDNPNNPTFDMWLGYADGVMLGDDFFDAPGEIVLTADPGNAVTLFGFDVAPWTPNIDDLTITISDGNGNTLFTDTINTPEVRTEYAFDPGLTAQVIVIRLEDFGDWAIDDIIFGQGEPLCPFDTDGDNIVGLSDLLTVLAGFGSSTPNGAAGGDFDNSGLVDLNDLLDLLGNFGTNCR